MESIYRLNSREMGIEFVNSIKVAYPDQSIEITVRRQTDVEIDETEYLLNSPSNREHLIKAIKEEKLITFETVEEARKCADKWAAEN